MSTETRRFSKYELRERLGQDEMVETWKAFDTQLQRYVVIKFPHTNLQNDPDFLKRFEHGAKVAVSLNHPNLAQIYDAQVARSSKSGSTNPYIAVDYIEGQTLADYIHNTSRVGNFPSISDIIYIFTAISSAVDYAHQKGIIYCNIKPTNILLDKHNTARCSVGEPILANFEVPTLCGNSSNVSMETVPYISPEQARGYPGNEHSDIYSLGVILYEICAGVPPFSRENPTDVMMQHMKAAPTPPEQLNWRIPPALSKMILRSLAKDPMARFPNASTMAVALADAFNRPTSAVSTRPAPVTPLPLQSSPPKRRRRKPLLIALVALLLLLLASSGLGAFVRFSRPTSPVVVNQIVGHAYFESSGQFIENSTNGINDELHLIMHNISSPALGKSYYLWLLSDKNQKPTTFILLGTVQVNSGNVDSIFTTPQHTNLIAITSRLLITEESTNLAPGSFSTNLSTWRYYTEIPQTYPSPGVPHLTTLGFLRLLLFEGTKLAAQGLHGGSAIRLLRNTGKVLEWASSARDEWDLKNFPLMHRHFIRILDYLDGLPFVQADLSPGTRVLVNPILAQNGLVTVIPGDNPEAYTPRIAFHILSALEAAHGLFSSDKVQLALEVDKDVRVNLEYLLQLVRRDAKQLVTMTDGQLAQRSTLSLLNEMLTQANYAYAGQFDPVSGHLQGGALNDYNLIQTIASFDIFPCPGSQCTVK